MTTAPDSQVAGSFRHEAVFYSGLDDLVGLVAPFVVEGLELGEAVLVAELPDRVRVLEKALGDDAARVSFIDMTEVGRNPACIIPEWRRFVDEHRDSGGFRGVGEPAWAGRRAVELEECRLHEALLNVAFDDGPAWQLLCPYDASALPTEVLRNAMLTHPTVHGGAETPFAGYEGHAHASEEFTRRLPDPPSGAEEIRFGEGDLSGLRSVVRRLCDNANLQEDVVDDLVLAAHELAANSVVHGGGGGTLRAWDAADDFVLEVDDAGVIDDVLVGRSPQVGFAENGRGVWMANQLCDLVQVRSSAYGTTVRVHTWL
jgi:anti-sigma regulatory factor (Ser/Thr protein kinase)